MFDDMFIGKTEPFPEIPWIDIREYLPKDGDDVIAKSATGWWAETWDNDEPIGQTTHWKLIPIQEFKNV